MVVIATTKKEEEEEEPVAESVQKARSNINTLRGVALAQERFKRASLQRQRTKSSMVSKGSLMSSGSATLKRGQIPQSSRMKP